MDEKVGKVRTMLQENAKKSRVKKCHHALVPKFNCFPTFSFLSAKCFPLQYTNVPQIFNFLYSESKIVIYVLSISLFK